LIEPPAVIAFSGGLTSGYMLRHILDAYSGTLPDDIKVSFQNTGKERPETLEFVHRCETEWGVPITWLEYRPGDPKFAVVDYDSASRDGEPFEALIRKKQYLPNSVARFCTSELKVLTQKRWLQSLGWDAWDSAIGLRSDEPRRLARRRARQNEERWDDVFPLAQAGVGLRDVEDWWSQHPFSLELSRHEGNCDLCFLKGPSRRLRIIEDRPDLAEWWARIEKEIDARFDKRRTYASLADIARRQLRLPLVPGDDLLDEDCNCTW